MQTFTEAEIAQSVEAYQQALETGTMEGLQVFRPGREKWEDLNNSCHSFLWGNSYRLKPKEDETEPIYREWRPEEALGKSFYDSVYGFRVIIGADASHVHFVGRDKNIVSMKLEYLLKSCQQLDGSPCGELETEEGTA